MYNICKVYVQCMYSKGETITRDYDLLSIIFLINRLFSYQLIDEDLQLRDCTCVNECEARSQRRRGVNLFDICYTAYRSKTKPNL